MILIKKIFKELKDLKNHPLYKPGRWTEYKNGYRVDRYIFKVVMGLMFLYLLFIMYQMNFNFIPKASMVCHEMECDNPFFIDPYCPEGYGCPNGYYDIDERRKCTSDWCNISSVPKGEYGEQPSKIYKSFLPVTFLLLVCGLLLNHFLHNKQFKLDLGEDN